MPFQRMEWLPAQTLVLLKVLEDNRTNCQSLKTARQEIFLEASRTILSLWKDSRVNETKAQRKYEYLASRHRRRQLPTPHLDGLIEEGTAAIDPAYLIWLCESLTLGGRFREYKHAASKSHRKGRLSPPEEVPNDNQNLPVLDQVVAQTLKSYWKKIEQVQAREIEAPVWMQIRRKDTRQSTTHRALPAIRSESLTINDSRSESQGHDRPHKAPLHLPPPNQSQSERPGSTKKDWYDNVEAFVPHEHTIQRNAERLIDQIQLAVRRLCSRTTSLNATFSSDLDRTPLVEGAVQEPGFKSLCSRMFRTKSSLELYKMPIRTGVTLEDMMRATIAVALRDWVFHSESELDKHLKDALDGKDTIAKLYSKVLQEVDPRLAEQTWLKTRYLYIHEKLDAHGLAQSLATRFDSTVDRFLNENRLRRLGDRFNEWFVDIAGIFHTAIKFKALMLLRPWRAEYDWPAFNDSFSPNSMRAEEGEDAHGTQRVLLAYFPAIIEINDEYSMVSGEKRHLIFESRVGLQPQGLT